MKNILSIDVEDWYHGLFSLSGFTINPSKDRVRQEVNLLFDFLKRKNTIGTIFILGEIVEKYPDIVQKFFKHGFEIGVHTYSHKRVNQMTPLEFSEDLKKCKDVINNAIAVNPVGFRAPAFSINHDMNWAFEILCQEGFKFDSSLFPTLNPLYGDIKSPLTPFSICNSFGSIKEFPMSTLNIMGVPFPVAGGFYLRALPLWIVEWGIKQCNENGYPFILYMHPWEIDPKQTKPSLINNRERITHYYNVKNTLKKLDYLLEKYEFTSFEHYEAER